MPSMRAIHMLLLLAAMAFTCGAIVWNGLRFAEIKGGTYPVFVMAALIFAALLAYRIGRVRGHGRVVQ